MIGLLTTRVVTITSYHREIQITKDKEYKSFGAWTETTYRSRKVEVIGPDILIY